MPHSGPPIACRENRLPSRRCQEGGGSGARGGSRSGPSGCLKVIDTFRIVKFGQGFGSLSEPSKFLEKLIAERRFIHGGNPLSAWQASCCVVTRDAAGNIKPAKDKSRGRIDGMFALVNAIGVWLEEQKEAELDWTISSF